MEENTPPKGMEPRSMDTHVNGSLQKPNTMTRSEFINPPSWWRGFAIAFLTAWAVIDAPAIYMTIPVLIVVGPRVAKLTIFAALLWIARDL